ncbi:JmjC domain-containing protein [Clavibacter nebraskensis]|nr:cupin domain-containing protein [Clavibacter nebraskensis]KXU21708.1 hypothetical protein VV38_02415 [Clavibacter nebraskensis]OAH22493.1 hypothetical protein A3Q38_00805 [Clavibacter nebraskensis]QGV65849.2 hypothetical protein EGX36_02775 [Clavibacter nebraskensis]QGV68644.2 hypothetical protein EGX37_02760 [Clavibacter nebraskensis]QGV71435.2 hypothetical protein EGX35_02760 [Clavibacter nebraskensis]
MDVVTFEDLAGDEAEFLDSYRDARPLLRLGAISSPEELVSLRDIDDLLNSEAIRPPYFRMAKGGDQIRDGVFTRLARVQLAHMDDVVDPAKVLQAFRGGATITWNSMNHFNARLRDLTTMISRTLGCRSDVVSFLTPGGGVQGFAPHLDSTEVFVIRISGTKSWKVWDTLRPRPTAGYALDASTLGPPSMEFVMSPGDVLYLPWGTPPVAASVDQLSLHLSVTTKPRSLGELLGDVVRDAVEGDPAFAAQPTLNTSRIEEVTTVLASALQKLVLKLDGLQVEEAARSLVKEAAQQLGSGRIGFFEAVANAEADLSEVSVLRRREGEDPLSYAAAEEGRVQVVIGARTYAMSAGAVPALAILRERHVVRVDELASEIGTDAAITLGRTLLRIGHLVPEHSSR